MTDSIYTQVKGTTAHIGHERGTVVGFTRAGGALTGAFVRLHLRAAMLYVALGNPSDERGNWHAVIGSREISRDEFDRLSGLAEARLSMGWNIPHTSHSVPPK